MDITLAHEAEVIEFGRYKLLTRRGELLDDGGRAVTLGARATAVLRALIGARGHVLSQDQLLESAWPGQDIHASNLRVQISALRKALAGDRGMIGTVAGRGYLFAGRLGAAHSGSAAAHSAVPLSMSAVPVGLPLPMSELIGREPQVQEVLARIGPSQVLTLCGAGGIGKTLLALTVAHRVALAPGGGACWVDLSEARHDAGVAGVVGLAGAALGLAPCVQEAEAGAAALAARIGHQPLLLVLDNCEQVVDPVARLVELLLQRCPNLRLLATSRQPLLAGGETVWRVPPLATPDEDERDAARVLRYSAVQLFAARVRASESQFELTPHLALVAGAICRRLEGLPLAIELAAACVPALGVEQTASGLSDMLRLLRRGRRNAPPRHQTLRAALDWSHELLTDTARTALRQLAALQGGFTLEAAVAALTPHGLTAYEAIDGLAGLVTHSLAVVDHCVEPARYRLLETTRAYGLDRLQAGG